MGYDRDIPTARKWDLRFQGAVLCVLAEILLFVCWMLWQVALGLAAMGRY